MWRFIKTNLVKSMKILQLLTRFTITSKYIITFNNMRLASSVTHITFFLHVIPIRIKVS